MRTAWCLSIWMCCTPLVAAEPAPALAGSVQAEVDGRRVVFPLLKTDVRANVKGDLASVTVVQTFSNPLQEPVHARYLFPLNQDAAVHAMTMEVGDERIRAKIQQVHTARQTFETARQEGKAAALLEQHRPNMFTQNLANLMPGLPVRVALEYVQTVPKVDGHYELAVPLVVGPRFQPPGSAQALPEDAQGAGATFQDPAEPSSRQWQLQALPDYPPVVGLDVPRTVDPDRVALTVELESAMPIQWAESATHPLQIEEPAAGRRRIALAGGRTIDNRDFVLRYALAGETTNAGLLSERHGTGGYFSLLIEPPADPQAHHIMFRELVFVLDCSGSMSGLPMDASKAFMREALANLRPDDSFRIIRFSDAATEFSRQPLPATPDNIRRGIAYTDALYGSGGTMMTSGILQALGPPVAADAVRLVVFLTDGYIGNELEVLHLIETLRGAARLYAFGVGAGVNRYLLEEMGRVGHGFTRYMDPTEDPDAVAQELAGRIDAPVLTDIEIDWGDMRVRDVTPSRIPDLFAGQSVRVQGRFDAAGDYQVQIQGRSANSLATLRVPVSLPAPGESGGAGPVALVWARSTIKDAMHALTTPTARRPTDLADDAAIQSRVTRLGLEHSLVTRWTAFVAVSERIYNTTPSVTGSRDVPLPMVAGVTANAYPQSSFGGVVTPEPAEWLAMALLTLVVIGCWARSREAA